MKLVGITNASNSGATVAAIHYRHEAKSTEIRMDPSVSSLQKDFHRLPDFDEMIILGKPSGSSTPNYRVLAQIYPSNQTAPVTPSKQIHIQPCRLKQTDPTKGYPFYATLDKGYVRK